LKVKGLGENCQLGPKKLTDRLLELEAVGGLAKSEADEGKYRGWLKMLAGGLWGPGTKELRS
jgi:hypothetical protein